MKRSERHRYGLAVTLDDDGLFVVRALILPQRENQTDVPAARDHIPLAAAEAGAPPLAGSPSAASTPAADGTISPDEHGWGDASGLSDAAFAAAAARAAGAPSVSRGALVSRDTPLPAAARRIAEAAATRAVADVVAVTLHLALAQAVVVLAVAGAHSDPVKLTRGQGPWSAKHPLLLAIARAETWCEAFALALAATLEELLAALREVVAAATDLRGARYAEMAAMLAAAERQAPHLRARVADILDYEAFFRAAPRVVSLRALNELGGIAMETSNSWRDHDDLAHEAAIVARAKRWLPEFLREGPPP